MAWNTAWRVDSFSADMPLNQYVIKHPLKAAQNTFSVILQLSSSYGFCLNVFIWLLQQRVRRDTNNVYILTFFWLGQRTFPLFIWIWFVCSNKQHGNEQNWRKVYICTHTYIHMQWGVHQCILYIYKCVYIYAYIRYIYKCMYCIYILHT